jgi:hypothetical protein
MPTLNYDPTQDQRNIGALSTTVGTAPLTPPVPVTGGAPSNIGVGPINPIKTTGGQNQIDYGDTSYLTGIPNFNFGQVPGFTPPNFKIPTALEASNDPGYQFRLEQGQHALESSAAAKGLLRTGGTLKDLMEYGQNFATQTYTDVFNRALSAYDRQYQASKDIFAPSMAEYQLKGEAQKEAALAQYQRGFDLWKFMHTPPPAPVAPSI